MPEKSENKFLTALKRIAAVVLAAGILVGLYKISTPYGAAVSSQVKEASVTASIDEFLKGKTFISTVYHPSTPPPELPMTPQAQVYPNIVTDDPVVFLTIDDGVYDDTEAFAMMYERGVSASLFLNDNAIKTHYDYFAYWRLLGSTIQNHTVSHPHMGGLTHEQQKHEICDNANLLEAAYGKRPTLFRAPYGETNNSTAQAATECNMKTIVLWSVVVEDSKISYREGSYLRPGDIILLHFTPHLHDDLKAIFKQIDSQHMQIGQLEDWLR